MRCILLLAASIVAFTPVAAAAEWLALRTKHHQVAGNVSARDLKDVALRVEQFREVIATLNQATIEAAQIEAKQGVSAIVLAFPDERSYRPFMPMANGRRVPVGGLFVAGPRGTYITLNLDAGDDAYRGIYHEYSHYLLRNVFGAAPLWFNEGLAEYYSTLEVSSDGRRAVIGKPVPQHVELLRERRLPLATLLSITAASPIYSSDTPERSVMYAQSWAMVHHALHAQPRRRDALIDLAFKLAAGMTPEQAVLEAYGMTIPDLEREVQAYTRREIYQATSFEFKDAITTTLGRNPMPADEGEVEAWLGGVQMTIGRPEEGAVRLEKALKTRPDVVAALSRSNYQLRVPGRVAVLATMRAFLNQGEYAAVRGALTPMVRANPADHEAALMLAEALLRLDDPDGARALLGPVLAGGTDVRKEQARALLGELAEVRERLGNPPAAPPADAQRGSSARTPDPQPPPVAKNQGLILQLRNVQPGEQRIQGTIQGIECTRSGVVVVIGTPQGATRASAPSLASIMFVTFRSQTGGAISCGAQVPAPALLTTRREGTRTIAVALELLPDGYEP
ncbi:MAG: peptidase MA family metallohydrolase [Vicinamibacterales bacterium]